jgi:hypothetical protein
MVAAQQPWFPYGNLLIYKGLGFPGRFRFLAAEKSRRSAVGLAAVADAGDLDGGFIFGDWETGTSWCVTPLK